METKTRTITSFEVLCQEAGAYLPNGNLQSGAGFTTAEFMPSVDLVREHGIRRGWTLALERHEIEQIELPRRVGGGSGWYGRPETQKKITLSVWKWTGKNWKKC